MTPRVLALGATGQVGRELVRIQAPPGLTVRGLSRADLDITDKDAVMRVISAAGCDLVVNAAGYTAVDRAEANPMEAFGCNRDAPKFVADTCRAKGIPLVQISTDYVFDGTESTPYREDDAVDPRNVYGISKAGGERAVRDTLEHHIILRTSWVFSAHGDNFVKTMLRLGEECGELEVVDDQVGCPTAAGDIAKVILEIARQVLLDRRENAWGTFHFAGDGPTSWCGFARFIFEQRKALTRKDGPRITPVATADFPAAARRPAYSVLDCTRIRETFRIEPRGWRLGLAEVMGELLEVAA